MELRDAKSYRSCTLPNGAATSVSAPTDTGLVSILAKQVANWDGLISAPAMNATQMPDGKTMTYDVVMSLNADLSSPTVLYPGVIVQTGAGGVGCAAAEFRFRIPSTAKRYIGFRATGSASGNASGSVALFEQIF